MDKRKAGLSFVVNRAQVSHQLILDEETLGEIDTFIS